MRILRGSSDIMRQGLIIISDALARATHLAFYRHAPLSRFRDELFDLIDIIFGAIYRAEDTPRFIAAARIVSWRILISRHHFTRNERATSPSFTHRWPTMARARDVNIIKSPESPMLTRSSDKESPSARSHGFPERPITRLIPALTMSGERRVTMMRVDAAAITAASHFDVLAYADDL